MSNLVRLMGAVIMLAALNSGPATAADITVFAAASLSDSLQDVAKAYQIKSKLLPALSFASSSVLARQIEASSGADIFISADEAWMNYVDERGLVVHGSRQNLLANRLVLIEPAGTKLSLAIAPRFDLLHALKGGRLSIADPYTVPAGKYARQALTKLGVWNDILNHVVSAENVRVALAYVAGGEAPLGIVYATDAISEKRVAIVGTFPDDTHAPIVYPAALIRGANSQAGDFLNFLSGPQARAIFTKYGFTVLQNQP